MARKTVEELLEEQNDLIRQQVAAANYASYHADAERAARAWDEANPFGKYLWLNPYRR